MGRAQGRKASQGELGKVMGELHQRGGGQGTGSLPPGKAGPPRARRQGRQLEEAGNPQAGGGEEEGEAGLPPGQPGARPLQGGQGLHPLTLSDL